jgi:hypothetical protein
LGIGKEGEGERGDGENKFLYYSLSPMTKDKGQMTNDQSPALTDMIIIQTDKIKPTFPRIFYENLGKRAN